MALLTQCTVVHARGDQNVMLKVVDCLKRVEAKSFEGLMEEMIKIEEEKETRHPVGTSNKEQVWVCASLIYRFV